MIDPMRHPDLVEVERRLRRQFQLVLEAEQAAALVRHRRSMDLRDHLLEAEDRGSRIAVSTTDGELWTGRIGAVGADHVTIDRDDSMVVVMLYQVVAVELMR